MTSVLHSSCMMKSLVLLILAVLAAICRSTNVPSGCTVGAWGDWSECISRRATPDEPKPVSFAMPESRMMDRGRSMMKYTHAAKEAQLATNTRCITHGKCPELSMRTGYGPKNCTDGFAGEYQCDNIDLLSFMNFHDLGYWNHSESIVPRGNDIWGWVDPETGDEYAIMGLCAGTSFVRITDPSNPVTLAFLYTSKGRSVWRDIKVVDNTAYIGSEAWDHGMQVFDLLRLRDMTEFSFVEADFHYQEVGQSHNIIQSVESKTIIIVGARDPKYKNHCSGGLHFVDVSDRLKPRFVGCYAEDGYTHDAQCVIYHGPDTTYQGREICFAYNEDTITIVDVTDKSDATMISKEGYSGAMYTHQGWVTEDHTVLLLDDECDEWRQANETTKTYIWDVSNLTNPVLMNTYYSSEKSIDHNQYILGDYTYQSNYAAGLRILHIDQDKYDLEEVAYFDVLPTVETRAEFEGTWSNYPYLPSGNVIVSSIDFGLFILRPHYDEMEESVNSQTERGTMRRVRDILHATRGSECPATEHRRNCPVEY